MKVSPAPAGMIPMLQPKKNNVGGEPRTRGDDPDEIVLRLDIVE